MPIVVGNAPVSWAVYEAHSSNPPWAAVLDAMAQAGYAATELGPYGYFPTEAARLTAELRARGLVLASSFVAVSLEDASKRGAAIDHCMRVASLLASQGVRYLIVADDEDPQRAKDAGRIANSGAASWSDAQWQEAGATLNAIGRAIHAAFGMSVVVHHHAGTFIETASEIRRCLDETDPNLVGLLIDTGHATYGGADPCALLESHGDRVRYVHCKDMTKAGVKLVRSSSIAMKDAWRKGVFCPLGDGCVDFSRFTRMLRERGYEGFLIVEQDVVLNDEGKLVPDPLECAKRSRQFLKGLGL